MKRPDTLEGMIGALDRFVTEDGMERALAFQPQASDVIVAPFGKCGTTWMQQIVHGLRSGGDMSFEEISGVVPWIELAHDMGIDLDSPQTGPFRAFKSHLSWDRIPKGGRYIVVLRDPLDAMVSMYSFFENWFFVSGTVGLEAFADYYLDRADGRDYWTHLSSWWAVRERDDVLLVAYEHMKQNLPDAVTQVARFVEATDSAVLELATRQATFDFMKAHGRKFDDHLTRDSRDPACGLPAGSETSKLGIGKTGQGKPLVSERSREIYDRRWQETMGGRFGLPDYESLLEQLPR